jgi:hypothetical protein
LAKDKRYGAYTPDEALSLLIETKLTKSQYMEIRTQGEKN